MFYINLNEAAVHVGDPRYGIGGTGIWYSKNLRDVMNAPIDLKDLSKTHTYLGSIDCTKNEVMTVMQGENWSPSGEAKDFISNNKLKHTSMSQGDVFTIDEKTYQIGLYGEAQIVGPSEPGAQYRVSEALDNAIDAF